MCIHIYIYIYIYIHISIHIRNCFFQVPTPVSAFRDFVASRWGRQGCNTGGGSGGRRIHIYIFRYSYMYVCMHEQVSTPVRAPRAHIQILRHTHTNIQYIYMNPYIHICMHVCVLFSGPNSGQRVPRFRRFAVGRAGVQYRRGLQWGARYRRGGTQRRVRGRRPFQGQQKRMVYGRCELIYIYMYIYIYIYIYIYYARVHPYLIYIYMLIHKYIYMHVDRRAGGKKHFLGQLRPMVCDRYI